MTINILDPAQYAAVRRPFLEAETLPAWCYTSQAFYEREVERIFLKVWIFVGRSDEIPNPGDYFTVSLAGGPVIVIRGHDGTARAFANTCRHRGSRLLEGKGNCRSIVCPYHGWTYGLDGRLAGASHMDQTVAFDRARYGLSALRLESWAGFLFVTFDPEAESLMAYLGDMPEQFESYNFGDMAVTRRTEYTLACNWKLYAENTVEDYHTAYVHRGSIGNQECVLEETRGNWDAVFMKSDATVAVLPGESTPLPHVATLRGRPAHGTYFTLIYPNTTFGSTQDCMWWLTVNPEGPDRSRLSIGTCFPRSTVALPRFAAAVERYYHRWDTSIPEDNWIGEAQQAGLRSVLRGTGPLSWKEPMVHRIANWVLDRVLDSPPTHLGSRGDATAGRPRSRTLAVTE